MKWIKVGEHLPGDDTYPSLACDWVIVGSFKKKWFHWTIARYVPVLKRWEFKDGEGQCVLCDSNELLIKVEDLTHWKLLDFSEIVFEEKDFKEPK